jgi:hypothetical protein
MSAATAHIVVAALAVYLAAGVAVALPLVIFGLRRLDAATHGAPWTFRVLVFPGAVALWPFLLRRWLILRRGA